jgi:predicted membrane protein
MKIKNPICWGIDKIILSYYFYNIMTKRKKITKKEKQWINQEMERLSDPKVFRLKETVEPNSNFINLSKGYYNKGKYKGVEVERSPISYIEWLLNKSGIILNKGEIKLLNKIIENKKPH